MADEHAKALSMLAQAAKLPPARQLRDVAATAMYDFEHLAETLSDALMQSAEDLMADAHRLADDMRRLAADIRNQATEHSKGVLGFNARLKASGEQVLEAHRKFNGGG